MKVKYALYLSTLVFLVLYLVERFILQEVTIQTVLQLTVALFTTYLYEALRDEINKEK